MQKLIFIIGLSLITNISISQNNINKNTTKRHGFTFGVGIGAGTLSLKSSETKSTELSVSLPNLKIGYSFNQRFSFLLTLPGATYKLEERDRGFEGIILTGQFWMQDKWWISSGVGLTFDAPAFYTVKDIESENFYTGLPAFTVGTGYEIFRKGRFTIDLQYRFFFGKSKISDDLNRQGLANMFIIGFNWY